MEPASGPGTVILGNALADEGGTLLNSWAP